MDRIEAMATLLAVVRAGSLSAASRELRTPIATVSRRISELEAHLGTRLLTRTTRRITLTDAGEAYAAACRHILEQVEEAERAASGEYRAPRGELTVTASMMLGRRYLTPIATDFLGAYPDVVVHLRLSDRALDLHQEHVDVAVRLGPLPDSSLVARRVGEIRRVLAASPEYLARRGTPGTPAELAGHDCLDFAGFRTFSAWDLSPDGAETGVRPRLSIDTAEPLVDAAIAGAGIVGLFSFHIAAAVRAGQLVPLLRGFEPPPLPVHLVYLGGGPLPLKVRAFLDFAAPRLKAALEADVL
ncbi:MAG TPA: LysR family transcriptional regulator [Crenalkalicoccus sp.]|jgi:DNA-binding transcriptional LysR family regulator|nr:LysR family transcriptional regulator [Crenalkalicoccus sp.]